MPRPAKDDDNVLSVVERYRTLILEEAQTAQAQCAEFLAGETAACTKIEDALQSAYTAHRTNLEAPNRPLSPDTLRLSYYHARAQSDALEEARAARERAEKRLTQAQDRLSARLEDLKVIERLRERRAESETLERRRRAQWRLDELGIMKVSQEEGRWPSAE